MNLEEVRQDIMASDSLLLTTHRMPDGDGLGAQYALASALLRLNKDVLILNADPPPSKYAFIDKKNLIKTLGIDGELPQRLQERTLLILDTDPSNIGNISDSLLTACRDVIVIDHHSPKEKSPYKTWLVTEASSTCALIFDLIESLEIRINKEEAVALYTGIVYDTGSFIYPKTQANTFRIAEKLVSKGAVPNKIHTALYESKSIGSLLLHSLVTSTLVLHENNAIAVQMMPQDTLIASGALYEESQEIVNIPLQCEKVRLSLFFKENEQGSKSCSLRSKGEIDCAKIAQQFNGGGHQTAAGFRFTQSFAEIQTQILKILQKHSS